MSILLAVLFSIEYNRNPLKAPTHRLCLLSSNKVNCDWSPSFGYLKGFSKMPLFASFKIFRPPKVDTSNSPVFEYSPMAKTLALARLPFLFGSYMYRIKVCELSTNRFIPPFHTPIQI